ncbi:MAG: hypothetical protein ABIG70_04170 [Pseudomonadota bacterium]
MNAIEILSRIKLPRNVTGAMQLMQLHAQTGHHLWCSDVIRAVHLEKFIMKFGELHVERSAPMRLYWKRRGNASVHLILLPEAVGLVRWVLMSTPGKNGLQYHAPGAVGDLTMRGQHLQWRHYELLRLPKEWRQDERRRTDETVTWRMQPEAYKTHEALIVDRAQQHDHRGLLTELEALRMQPLFAGVRNQVWQLQGVAHKVWAKFNRSAAPLSLTESLPILSRLPIYDNSPRMALEIVEAMK